MFAVSVMLLPHLFHCLAYLGSLLVGRVADGDEGYGFQAFGHGHDFVELVDVEVAHPTGGKALLGSSHADCAKGAEFPKRMALRWIKKICRSLRCDGAGAIVSALYHHPMVTIVAPKPYCWNDASW